MLNKYRIAQRQPYVFQIEMFTVSGWIPTFESPTDNLQAAQEQLMRKIEREAFVPHYFDVAGNEISPN